MVSRLLPDRGSRIRPREGALRQPTDQIAQRILVDLVSHFIFSPGGFDPEFLQLLLRFLRIVDRHHRIVRTMDDQRRERRAEIALLQSRKNGFG